MQTSVLAQGSKSKPSTHSENYNAIDLVKFICAFLVCTIHIAPFPEDFLGCGATVNFALQHYICRLAVPFFFVSSGFFLFRKMDLYDLKSEVIKDYCMKLLRLLGTWSVLLVVGSTGHLWYLSATVVAVILLSVLLKRNIKLGYLILIAIVLYMIGVLGDSYYRLLDPLKEISFFKNGIATYEFFFVRTRNGVFMGFVFVLMGALFAHKKIKMNMKLAVVGFIFSMLLLGVEAFAVKHYAISKSYNMYVFLLPATLFLFYIVSQIKLKDRNIYKTMRVAGMLIFYMHLFVGKCVGMGLDEIRKATGINYLPYKLLITIIVVTALAFSVTFLSRKEKFKWLRWIYS